jgi:lysophospholipase L1-like esterase
MDDGSQPTWDLGRILRLLKIAALFIMVYLALILGPPWFQVFFPPMVLHRIYVRLLIAAQIAYGVFLLTVPVTSIVLTVVLLKGRRSRRRGASRPWLVRGLALCLALMVSLAIAEGTARAWLEWTRVPMPWLKTRFPDPPGEATVDILVLGESSAVGVPYQEWLSVGQIVAWKLGEAFPDRRFPVVHLARPGLTLDKVHDLMRSIRRRPDLVILYAGHNEFQMRYDWGHSAFHYDDETPPVPVSLADFAREHSPLCRLIQQTIGMYRMSLPPVRTVNRQLVDVPAYTADEHATRLNDFRARLEAMTAYCERVGALVVLVVPTGNDADFEPNRSFLPPPTPRADRAEFAEAFQTARRAEQAGPAAGTAAYEALLARQPGFAEAHYRLARLLETAGRRAEANSHFVAARDCDGFPMRCPSDFQNIYREVAARHPRAILIDGPEVLRRASARGVVGDEFFSDGFHPSLIGYNALARAILKGLHARRAFGWPSSSPRPDVGPSDCAAHFGMDATKWATVCAYSAWFYQFTAFIRFDPSERLAKQARYLEARRRIEAGSPPDAVQVPGVGTGRVTDPRP